jgi:hypothetical protein
MLCGGCCKTLLVHTAPVCVCVCVFVVVVVVVVVGGGEGRRGRRGVYGYVEVTASASL